MLTCCFLPYFLSVSVKGLNGEFVIYNSTRPKAVRGGQEAQEKYFVLAVKRDDGMKDFKIVPKEKDDKTEKTRVIAVESVTLESVTDGVPDQSPTDPDPVFKNLSELVKHYRSAKEGVIQLADEHKV